MLVEHTNEERGDGECEHVPCVIGMSIPQPTNARLWAIFVLAYFKPFGVSNDLLAVEEDPVACYESFKLTPRNLEILKNWEAVHECEDKRDAERLHKRAQLTAESKALTASFTMPGDDNKINFAVSLHTPRQTETDSCINQAVLNLHQSRWLAKQEFETVSVSPTLKVYPCDVGLSALRCGKLRSNNKSKRSRLLDVMC